MVWDKKFDDTSDDKKLLKSRERKRFSWELWDEEIRMGKKCHRRVKKSKRKGLEPFSFIFEIIETKRSETNFIVVHFIFLPLEAFFCCFLYMTRFFVLFLYRQKSSKLGKDERDIFILDKMEEICYLFSFFFTVNFFFFLAQKIFTFEQKTN
jgi:hypothetical protein